jgi:NDP-sugar pyrophosphorylase family protein
MKPALVVLAAGMGSRYGGLKQMDQFGPSGETLLDYSVFDAYRAGFEKVVFVSRKDIVHDFRTIVTKKYESKMQIDFAMQELDMIPDGYSLPAERTKPLGTAHAVLVAREKLNEPFAVINADDFYGYESYRLLYDHLADTGNDECCIIGYKSELTLSEHGMVSRAILETDENAYLQKIIESSIGYTDQGFMCINDDGEHKIEHELFVSMNQMGFVYEVFEQLDSFFRDFLDTFSSDIKAESFLPSFVNQLIEQKIFKIKVIPTGSAWFGVTYKEDKPIVQKNIEQLVANGSYPDKLF